MKIDEQKLKSIITHMDEEVCGFCEMGLTVIGQTTHGNQIQIIVTRDEFDVVPEPNKDDFCITE